MAPVTRPRSLPYSPSFGTPLRLWRETETGEYPTRSPELSNQLWDMMEYCPEAARALDIYVSYALGSGGGDELGFALDFGGKQKRVEAAALETLARIATPFDWCQVVWRLLAWGDAFASMVLDDRLHMERLLLLPTWQLFRIEDAYGNLLGFEQRQPGLLSGAGSSVIELSPVSVVHWRRNARYLYGRSLFHEALQDWAELRFMTFQGMPEAARSVAIQPNLHIMPEGRDSEYKRRYREEHEAKKREGIIPDIYLEHGGEVRKPVGPPSVQGLDGLLNYVALRRRRIAVQSGVPLYLLGIEDRGAREIALQPATTFVVAVGLVRQVLAEGVRQVVDTALALRGFSPPYRYQVVFPEIALNPFEPGTVDPELSGTSDVGDT